MIRYDPPLDRIKYEQLLEFVRNHKPDAEIAEVIFKSGKRVLLIHLDPWLEEYVTVEPGDYLTSSGLVLQDLPKEAERMALNEGERNALLTQVTQLVEHAEAKIKKLGLPHIKVGLFDGRTREPISHPDHLIDMADGKPPRSLPFHQDEPAKPGVGAAVVPPIDEAAEAETMANTAKMAEETGLE
jgi:hypothetical protein